MGFEDMTSVSRGFEFEDLGLLFFLSNILFHPPSLGVLWVGFAPAFDRTYPFEKRNWQHGSLVISQR